MAISNERFKVSDNEFDLPIANFLNITDSSVLNIVQNVVEVAGSISANNDKTESNKTNHKVTDNSGSKKTVVSLYALPLSDKQLANVVEEVYSTLVTYKVYAPSKIASVNKDFKKNKIFDKLKPILQNIRYSSTHDYFRTSAEVINKFYILNDGSSSYNTDNKSNQTKVLNNNYSEKTSSIKNTDGLAGKWLNRTNNLAKLVNY